MSKSPALRLADPVPDQANVVRFPTRNPFSAAPAAAETVRLTVRHEVTTLALEVERSR